MFDVLRKWKNISIQIYIDIIFLLTRLIQLSHNPSIINSFYIRIWKQSGLNLSSIFFIDRGFKCLYPKNITIGKYVSLGHDNHIWAFQKITIGAYTQTAKDLLIISGSHDNKNLNPIGNQEIIIGAGCWIGARVTITGGLTIGKGVIIGAGAVVVNDIPDFAIAVGIPAKVIKYREVDETQWNPFIKYKLSELP